MPSIQEGRLSFDFPPDWRVGCFDRWTFYRKHFQKCGNPKAVDIIAVAPDRTAWVIEIKDYRLNPRTKTITLAQEMGGKVRDSLSALVAARLNATEEGERDLARAALRCRRIRVILHLELPTHAPRAFTPALDAVSVQQQMRLVLKAVDPHPKVLDMAHCGGVEWNVKEAQ